MMPKHLAGVEGWGGGGGGQRCEPLERKEICSLPSGIIAWLSTRVRATRKVFFFSQLHRSFFPLAKQTASYAG